MRRFLITALIGLIVLPIFSPANAELAQSDKVLLQVAMKQSINQRLVDGKFEFFDTNKGAIVSLYPVKSHTMILSLEDHYVLCSNFRNALGEDVSVDFYLAPEDNRFVVVDTVINNRAPLQRLLSIGKAKRIN